MQKFLTRRAPVPLCTGTERRLNQRAGMTDLPEFEFIVPEVITNSREPPEATGWENIVFQLETLAEPETNDPP